MRLALRWGLMAALLLAWMQAHAVETRDPTEYFFDQSFGDFREELKTARDNGKVAILVFFEMDECPFCHRMKTTVLNRSDVQDYYKEHFLILPVDIEGDVEMVDFTGANVTQKDFAFRQNRVRATPVFQFFDLDGNPIKRARLTGATRDAEEFLWLGEYVVDGVYQQQSFSRYKREKDQSRSGN